jgi:hypothetical protein
VTKQLLDGLVARQLLSMPPRRTSSIPTLPYWLTWSVREIWCWHSYVLSKQGADSPV